MTTPHPFASKLKKDPDLKLPRRAPRSKECTICNWFQQEVYPDECSDMNKRKFFAQQLRGSQAEFNAYKRQLAMYESMRSKGTRKRKRVPEGEEGEDNAEGISDVSDTEGPPAPRQKIAAIDSEQFEAKVCVGTFWPKAIYEKCFHKKISRRKLKRHDDQSGIFLPSDAWKGDLPDGVAKLYKNKIQKVMKQTKLFDSRLRIRTGQDTSAWVAAKSLVQVGSKRGLERTTDKSGAPISLSLSFKTDEAFGDKSTIFDDIWSSTAPLTFDGSGSEFESLEKTSNHSRDPNANQRTSRKSKPSGAASTYNTKKRLDLDERAARRLVFDAEEALKNVSGDTLGKLSRVTHLKLMENKHYLNH